MLSRWLLQRNLRLGLRRLIRRRLVCRRLLNRRSARLRLRTGRRPWRRSFHWSGFLLRPWGDGGPALAAGCGPCGLAGAGVNGFGLVERRAYAARRDQEK